MLAVLHIFIKKSSVVDHALYKRLRLALAQSNFQNCRNAALNLSDSLREHFLEIIDISGNVGPRIPAGCRLRDPGIIWDRGKRNVELLV